MNFFTKTRERDDWQARGRSLRVAGAAESAEDCRRELRIYEVTVLHGGLEVPLVQSVAALSVFAAAAAAMGLLIQIGSATTEDFLSRRTRVASVREI